MCTVVPCTKTKKRPTWKKSEKTIIPLHSAIMTSEYHNWSGPKISCLLTRWGPTESPAETPAPPKAKEEEKVPTTQTSGKQDMENGGCQTPCPFEGIWRVILVVVSINVFYMCLYLLHICIYDIYVSLLSIYILKYIEQLYIYITVSFVWVIWVQDLWLFNMNWHILLF